jgi:hypothetical protein
MNEVSHRQFGNAATTYSRQDLRAANSELSSGIGGSFASISIRGKAWRIKYQGEERVLMRDDGDGPRSSMEVVLIKAANAISKTYYEGGWEDGSSAPPDCWSTDGQKPDPASPKKQCSTCAGCPHNAFGSSNTGKGKACQDNKRLAVVPVADIENGLYNGPMLLRVSPTSLKELTRLSDEVTRLGYTYFEVATRLSLDVSTEYPRIIMKAVGPLTEEEIALVKEMRDDPRTQRILNEAAENVRHEPIHKPEPEDVFENPNRAAQKAAPKPAPAPAPKPAPVQVAHDPETGEVIEDVEIVEEEKPAPKAQAKPVAKPAEPKAQPKQTKAETPVADDDGGAAPGDFDDMLDELLG